MDQNLYNVYCALNNLNDTLRQLHGPLESNNELLTEQKEPLKLLTTFVGRLNGTMMRIEKQLEQLNKNIEMSLQEIDIGDKIEQGYMKD